MNYNTHTMNTRFVSLIPACCLALSIPVLAEDTKHHDSDYNKDREYKGAYDHALTPGKFVHKALKSGRKEVSAAKMAAERAQNPEVKTFASNLVTAHEKANERLTAIALRKGYPAQDTNSVSEPYYKSGTSQTYDRGVSPGVANTVRSLAGAQNGRGEPFFQSGAPVVPDTASSSKEYDTARRDTDTARRNAEPLRRDSDIARRDDAATPPGAEVYRGRLGTATRDTDTARQNLKEDFDPSRKMDNDAHQRLQSLQGAEFDRAFVRQMITDHNEAIDLYTRASRDIDDSELKAFASETLPTLQEHLSEAERLAGRGLSANR
jgi:predicted outer membrane protein